MSHSERIRKRVLRLKRHLQELGPNHPKKAHFENELSRLVTGKKPSWPVGTAVGVKQVKRKK